MKTTIKCLAIVAFSTIAALVLVAVTGHDNAIYSAAAFSAALSIVYL